MSVIKKIREKAASSEVREVRPTGSPRAFRTLYKIGDEVLVQIENKKCNTVKGKGVSVQLSHTGIVVDTNIHINKYKVKVDAEGKEVEEWLSVSMQDVLDYKRRREPTR